MPTTQFLQILTILNEYQVDYILIGGVSAALHGASISTFDIDIVHSREPENIERLLEALKMLNAYYRTHSPFQIVPDSKKLSSKGHHLLMTQHGAMDILGTVTQGRDYNDLLPDTILMNVPEDGDIRVISLPMLITLKRETGREKDKLALPILIHTLAEKSEK